jgi:hypothetical protein
LESLSDSKANAPHCALDIYVLRELREEDAEDPGKKRTLQTAIIVHFALEGDFSVKELNLLLYKRQKSIPYCRGRRTMQKQMTSITQDN